MSARIRGAKSELIELGEEEDTIVESTSKLRDMVKGMTGFDIMKDENTFKDIYEIVLGIGEAWSDLTDIEQASLGEALAGKRNANALYAVLNNLDTLKDAYETATDAEGSALREQENYAKSLQFEIDRIKANAQDISANIINSEALKSLLQLVNSIAEGVANITSNANALKVAIAAVVTTLSTIHKVGFLDFKNLKGEVSKTGILSRAKDLISGDSFQMATSLGISNDDIDLLNEYKSQMQGISEVTDKNAFAMNAWNSTIAKGSPALKKYVTTAQQGGTTLQNLGVGLQAINIKARLAAVGMNILNTAITMGASLLLTFALSKALEAFDNWIHRFENAADAFDKMNDSISQLNSQIEDNKKLVDEASESYAELAQGVDLATNKNISLSTEDYQKFVDLNKRLADSFPALVQGIGENGTKILELGDSAEQTTAKLQALYEQQERIANRKIVDELKENWGSTQLHFEDLQNQLNEAEKEFARTKESKDFINESFDYTDRFTISDNETASKIRNVLERAFQKAVGQDDYWDRYANNAISLGYNQDENGNYIFEWDLTKVENFNELVKEGVVDLDLLKDTVSEVAGVVDDEFARAGDNLAAVKDKVKQEYLTLLPSISTTLSALSTFEKLSDDGKLAASSFVNGFNEQFMAGAVLSDDIEQYLREQVIYPIQEIQEKGGLDKLISLDNTKTQEEWRNAFLEFKKFCEENEIDLPVQFTQRKTSDAYNLARNKISSFAYDPHTRDQELKNQWLDTLSESDLELFVNLKIDRSSTVEECKAALEEAKQEVSPVIIDAEFDTTKFSENLVDLKDIQNVYKTAINNFQEDADGNPIYIPVDFKDIEDLREKWVAIVGDEQFDLFENVVTNASSTEAEVQAVCDSMANSYVDAMLRMRGANAENAAIVESQLVKLGLEKEATHDYVIQATARAQAEEFVNTKLQEGSPVEQQHIIQLINEATQLGLTRDELNNYLVEAIAASNIKLTGDISWLDTLLEKLGITIGQLREYRHLMNISSGDAGDSTTLQSEKFYQKNNRHSTVIEDNTTKWDKNSDAINENTKATGGNSDAKEDNVDILSKINSQIDEIQDSYQKLEKIQEDYNSTGKISIDQAQELSNMDFRYLAILDTTAGQLDLNKDKWDDLTQAKINDLKIAMIQKALDLISTFKNEATAIEYLKNTYIDASNAALTFLDAQAQVEAMHLGEEGQKAADQVMLGLQNALTMMNNIDLNLHVDKESGHEGVDHSSSEHGGKTPEQEAFEEEVKEAEEKLQITYKDWMEIALDKVGKKVDKWTKSIDKLFKFWNKQWATNKALSAVRENIDLEKSAYNLYLKQASNAAKKAGRYIKSDEETLTYEIIGEESLTKVYKNLLKYGAKSIEEFDGTKESKLLLEKIEAFAEWFDKASAAQEAIDELYDKERELIKQKLSSITDYYDTIDGYLSTIAGRLDARANLKEAMGQRIDIHDLLEQYGAQQAIVDNAKESLTALTVGITKEGARERSEIEAEIAEHASEFDASTISNTKYINKATQKRDILQKRLDTYNDYIAQAEAATTASERKALKKKAKKYKLSKNQKTLLNYLNENIDKISELSADSLIDSTVANTAMYNDLQKKISKLQGKKKLSAKNQKKLNMYLDEMGSLNQGVLAEDVTQYRKVYEKWWKLDQEKQQKGYFKDASKYTEYDKLTKQKEEFEKKYKDYRDGLQKEIDQLNAIEQGEIENLTIQRDANLEELEESYNTQIDETKDSYESKKGYKKLSAQYQKLSDKQAAGKKLSKKEQKKLEKLTAEMEALEKGATDENFAEYKSTWEKWWKLDQKGIENLTASQKKLYDKYKNQLDAWDEEKLAEIEALELEKDDALEQATIEWDEKIEEAKTQLDEALTATYEQIKKIAEQEITDLQYLIDDLDTIINRYKEVAKLYESVSPDKINKYSGIQALLGVSGSDSEAIIKDQLEKAVTKEEEKVNKLITKGNLYKDLMNAAKTGGFDAVLSKYKSSLSETELSELNDVIKQLNESGRSADAWVSEWDGELTNVIGDLSSTIQEVQSLKDEIRENVYFKPIQNIISQLDAVKNRIEAMGGLIKDEWLFDSEGITEFGLAKAAILSDEYTTAQNQLQNYAKLIEEIDNQRASYGTDEDYFAARNEAMAQYYQQMQNVESIATQLYELSKKQQEEEINNVKKLADSYVKALQNKKSYWQYSKQIRDKTKSIEALRAEIDALNDVSDATSLATKAAKQAELDQLQQELDDMQMEHAFDLSADALNKFVEDLQSELDSSTQKIDETFNKFLEGLQSTLEMAKTADVASAMTKIAQVITGGDGTVKFTNDTSATSSSGSGKTTANLNTAGIKTEQYIAMDESTFVSSLQSTVVPSMNTANTTLKNISNTLTSISQNLMNSNSTQWIQKIHDTLAKSLQPNISQIADLMKDNGGKQDVTVNIHYDSLINVQGSVDSTVVKDMQKLTDDCVNKTKNSIYKDLRKNGVNIKY